MESTSTDTSSATEATTTNDALDVSDSGGGDIFERINRESQPDNDEKESYFAPNGKPRATKPGGSSEAKATTRSRDNDSAEARSDSSDDKESRPEAAHDKPQAQQAPKVEKKPAAATARKLGETDLDALVEIKVNGKVQELPLREAIKRVQMADAAEERLAQAKTAIQKARYLEHLAANDPEKFYELTGKDPYEISEKLLEKKLQLMQETPEQRELREYREKEAVEKERLEHMQEQLAKEKLTAAEREERTRLDNEFGEAMKNSRVFASPNVSASTKKYLFSQAAYQVMSAEMRGETLQARDAVAKVEEDYFRNTRSLFDVLDAHQIREILGDGVVKKLREFEVARVHQAAKATGQQPRATPALRTDSNTKAKQPMSEREWRKYMGVAD